MQNLLKRLILRLFDIGAIEFGAFRFKHHELFPDAPLAPMKINLRTTDHPKPGKLTQQIVDQIAFLFLDMIEENGLRFDYVAGIPRAGEPFTDVVAKILNKPLIRAKKTETDDKRTISRLIFPHAVRLDQSVLIFDDVITKGESKKEVIQIFEKAGLKIAAIIIFADRQEGGMEFYTKLGYRLIAATTITEILNLGLAEQRIDQQKYHECFNYLKLSKSI
jgi:orotate phosphoribosyltransferase